MERISVDGLNDVLKTTENKSGNVYILFCGSVVQDTGESWCSDCVKGKGSYTPRLTRYVSASHNMHTV